MESGRLGWKTYSRNWSFSLVTSIARSKELLVHEPVCQIHHFGQKMPPFDLACWFHPLFCWICILSFKKKRTPLKTTHVITLFLLLLAFHIQSYNHLAWNIFFWLKIIQLNNKKTEQKYGIQPQLCFCQNIPIASHCKYPKDLTKHSSQRVPSYEPWRKPATTTRWRFRDSFPPASPEWKQQQESLWDVTCLLLTAGRAFRATGIEVAYVFETETEIPLKLLE